MIDGYVAPGYEAVADEFERNFRVRGELGAAFAVVRAGEPVVDLWGGLSDRDRAERWQRDTLQSLFSGTKGLIAVCLLILLDRGLLDLDAPVSAYWPEFGSHGKQSTTIAEVVSHRGRLPGVTTPLSEADLTDPDGIAALLATQDPSADPRARYVYHPLTFGWLAAELIKRVDGRTAGAFFAAEVARPLDLDIWIGLPAEHEPRVSTLEYAPDWGATPAANDALAADDPLLRSMWHNPPIFPPGRLPWNASAFRRAEIAGAGAIGTARSMARLYGCLALGGEIDGVRLVSPDAVRLGYRALARGTDPFAGAPMAHGVGFALQTPDNPFGPVRAAFGHGGAGGSLHGAWPEHAVGFSYAMNQLRDSEAVDPRHQALLDRLRAAIA